MRSSLIALLLLCSGYVQAHQWSPTYPKLEPYYMANVYVAKMKLFNARTDVSYYEIQVFDANWRTIPFASKEKLIKIATHQTKNVDVFIRKQDRDRVTYICTQSKIKREDAKATVVASRICSKVK